MHKTTAELTAEYITRVGGLGRAIQALASEAQARQLKYHAAGNKDIAERWTRFRDTLLRTHHQLKFDRKWNGQGMPW
jgi:hypothetical protein